MQNLVPYNISWIQRPDNRYAYSKRSKKNVGKMTEIKINAFDLKKKKKN